MEQDDFELQDTSVLPIQDVYHALVQLYYGNLHFRYSVLDRDHCNLTVEELRSSINFHAGMIQDAQCARAMSLIVKILIRLSEHGPLRQNLCKMSQSHLMQSIELEIRRTAALYLDDIQTALDVK